MAGGSIRNPALREPVLHSCTPIGLQCSHTLVTFARFPTLVKCIPSLPEDPNYWYSTPLLNYPWWLYHTDPMGQHQSVLCSLQQGRESVLTTPLSLKGQEAQASSPSCQNRQGCQGQVAAGKRTTWNPNSASRVSSWTTHK